MRILHIIHQYFPEHVGGTEHYVRTLARAQQQAGHQVAIFARRGGNGQRLERDDTAGVCIYRAVSGPLSPNRRFWSNFVERYLAESLARVAAEIQPDLVHLHHLMGLPVAGLDEIEPDVPLVATLHDYWWVCANAQLITNYSGQVCEGPRAWLNCARCALARAGVGAAWPLAPLVVPIFALRARLLQRAMPRVAAWIAPTAFVARWHVEQGFPAGRVHVVGHGIELPPPEILARAAERTGSGGASHFAYVGGLAEQKGVHVLVDAFNNLPTSARLTVAGDETAFPEYCADLRRRAAHPGIRFVGRLERPQVWELLLDTDALIVPSLWYETASLVIQEAFAVRTPVVAADHGALSERVRHEVDGLLVSPGDVEALRRALHRLMEEPDLLPQLRTGIQPIVTVDEHLRQLDKVYRSVQGKKA